MRRVVVTGLGLVTPIGNSVEENWAAIVAGRSGIAPITHFDATDFPTKIAGEVRGLDVHRYIEPRDAKHMDPFVLYGFVAAEQAVADAGLVVIDEADGDRIGVYIGSGLSGVTTIEQTHDTWREKGVRRGFSPFFVPKIIANITGGRLSIKHGFRGPNFSHVSACSTGAHAIGEAARTIRHGYADAVVAGGTEATITPLGIGGFNAMRALSTRNDDPQRASRPFDRDRDGFVMGEGSGIVVLESLEHAQKRGARIYAEVIGYGMSGDAYHITAPSEDGDGAYRSMRMALKRANIQASDIQYVNAHGTSTMGDEIELAAVERLFGNAAGNLSMSSTKSAIGHLLGAAGSVEAIYSILAMTHGVAPPTLNLDNPSVETAIDLVPHKARERQIDVALSNSFGFGGTNASLVLRRVA